MCRETRARYVLPNNTATCYVFSSCRISHQPVSVHEVASEVDGGGVARGGIDGEQNPGVFVGHDERAAIVIGLTSHKNQTITEQR